MDLSIIIPMYNCEKTIINLLSSVNDFNKKNDLKIEVICIDDGSSDNTSEIVEHYIKNNNIVTLIKKENEGVSLTRNIGLKKSHGKYILFLDADDIINAKKLNNVVKKLTPDTELLFSGITYLKKDTIIHINNDNQKTELYKGMADISKYTLPISVSFAIYSKKFLIKNKLLFDKHLRMGEDLLFNLNCLSYARKITLVKEKYYYVQESHSQFLFKKENLNNELYFRKKSSQLFFTCNKNDRFMLNQIMAVKGISFLVYQYFVPCIFEKQISFNKAAKELLDISESEDYKQYIMSNNVDGRLCGREKLTRKLLSKKWSHVTLICGMIINKLKPLKRKSIDKITD